MFSKPLAFLLLALGCVTAAAAGAYVAARHNAIDEAIVPATAQSAAAVPQTDAAPATPNPPAVAETEAAVSTPKPAARTPEAEPEAEAPRRRPAVRRQERASSRTSAPIASRNTRVDDPAPQRTVPIAAAPAPVEAPPPAPAAQAAPAATFEAPKPIEPQVEAPRPPQFEEIILPSASVVGLQIESALSSEHARPEDRVDARVTRDVMAAGRVAIPAGARVLGSVTMVDRGGKMKEPGRLGVRFHTLILGDGSEVPLQTELITRTGESPAGKSAKKIGGAALGGAIIGAILGGGKGAAIGAGAGAAGGGAAVMAGDRAAATIRQGEIVNARLTAPATITVERRQ